MINATTEDTRVPKIAGAAPNFPALTSQSLELTIDNHTFAKAGQAAAKIAIAIAITSAGTISAHAVVTTS
ncbi:MAG TPA: hypothetical protein VK491_06340 [Gemmatimonadaceae bacterium]|nr:hypothetical protein [Gemmatimonadaceae bacterium]